MRRPDWELRLHDYLAGLTDARFEYGVLDCCLFAAGAAEAITGIDPMAEFRGQYDSEETGALALKTIGKGTLVRTMNAKFPRRPVAFAQRGDVVMVNGMLGVVFNAADALFVGEEGGRDGLVRFPRSAWQKCWKVD